MSQNSGVFILVNLLQYAKLQKYSADIIYIPLVLLL